MGVTQVHEGRRCTCCWEELLGIGGGHLRPRQGQAAPRGSLLTCPLELRRLGLSDVAVAALRMSQHRPLVANCQFPLRLGWGKKAEAEARQTALLTVLAWTGVGKVR